MRSTLFTAKSTATFQAPFPSASVLALTACVAALIVPISVVKAASEITGSIRIGATYEDTVSNDGELFIRNFGSRLKWSGETELSDSKKAIAYIELGLNPDGNDRGNSGIDRTRQLWAGLSGDFGTVKIGAQYAAFYDLISSHTDIAWWGSCWTQFECGRETQVLKYSQSSGALSYAASLQAPDDEDDDIADELEGGFNYDFGEYTVGLAASLRADEGAVDGGLLLGAVAKGEVGPAKVVMMLQLADEDYANADDNAINVTLGANLGDAYLIVNQGDVGSLSPFYATVGYTLHLGPSTLMYFEYQAIDLDTNNGSDTIARATYKFDF